MFKFRKRKAQTQGAVHVSGTFLDDFFEMNDEDQKKFVADLLTSFRPQLMPETTKKRFWQRKKRRK